MIFTISLGAVIQSLIGIVASQKFNDRSNEMHGEDFDKMREGVTNIFLCYTKRQDYAIDCACGRVQDSKGYSSPNMGIPETVEFVKRCKNQQKPILINLLRVMKLDRTFFRSVSQMKWNFFNLNKQKKLKSILNLRIMITSATNVQLLFLGQKITPSILRSRFSVVE